ncbi:MAG: hypothetical protein ACJ75B_10925 [Flavisolibacter sp.]
MDKKLCSIDLNLLKEMYECEVTRLRESLLGGRDWDELRDQRRTVTELAIALHQKRSQGNNPAENNSREK